MPSATDELLRLSEDPRVWDAELQHPAESVTDAIFNAIAQLIDQCMDHAAAVAAAIADGETLTSLHAARRL